jgi:hypothetical protein
MTMNRSLFLLRIAALAAAAASLAAQETIEQRLDRLERENRDLRTRVDSIAPPAQGGNAAADVPGFGKAYATDHGVSLAGYGEALFTQNSGRTDVADALRTVLYFGYRFDERWLFHSEIELEHGTTSDSSGTTTSGGEVSLEFGYLEYEACPSLSLRTGMVLVPVGLVNEQHEPTLFLPAQRAQTENRILPTTWRELGVEALATFGDCEAKWFVGTGLDGEEFSASGYRGGRQKGNREAADDIATALRFDVRPCEAVTVGASGFYQKAGQDGLRGTTPIPELDTVIAEGHVDWRPGRWIVRGLVASAWNDDAAQFDSATGRNLAERLFGAYAEVGYDVAPWLCRDGCAALIPFVRYENIDTQADMPAGIAANPANDSRILTVGLHVRPIERIVFKVDFESWDDSFDRLNLSMGYVF